MVQGYDEASALLARYTLGELESLEGIAQGIENTNFFLDTTTGRYVLTLFEKIPREDLPFYVGLMHHLAEHEIRCPAPMALQGGGFLTEVCGKPAVIVTRLEGVPHMSPTPEQCRKVGRILADIHEAGLEYDAGLANWRGQAWREGFAQRVRPKITADETALIESENRYQALHDDTVLPQGVIHGDLFRDNVLFAGDRVAGIVDFGFAATDFLAYDLAIAVNDWCNAADGELDAARTDAFIAAYQRLRPLSQEEREQWPTLLRAAALRFWLSRLYDLHLPRPGELVHAHDPAAFERILARRVAAMPRLPDARAA